MMMLPKWFICGLLVFCLAPEALAAMNVIEFDWMVILSPVWMPIMAAAAFFSIMLVWTSIVSFFRSSEGNSAYAEPFIIQGDGGSYPDFNWSDMSDGDGFYLPKEATEFSQADSKSATASFEERRRRMFGPE